jgi:hypothetical protein
LGHVFTSAMTGNLALLGIAVAHRDGTHWTRPGVARLLHGGRGGRRAHRPHSQADDPVWP